MGSASHPERPAPAIHAGARRCVRRTLCAAVCAPDWPRLLQRTAAGRSGTRLGVLRGPRVRLADRPIEGPRSAPVARVGLDACPALESAAPTDAQCAALGATLDTNATSTLDSSVNEFTGVLLDRLLIDQ